MSKLGTQLCDDLALVLQLACLTEDRANAEQKALLRVARAVDTEANKLVSRNKRMYATDYATNTVTRLLPESRLEQLVDETRELGDADKLVALPPRKGKPPAQQLPEGWRLVDA